MNPITRLATYHYQGNSLFLHRWRWFLSLVLLSLASPGYAQCVWKGANIGGDNYGASLQLGNVNITSNYIQPIDSILASSIISLVPARFWSDPEAVIYECDVADKDSLTEKGRYGGSHSRPFQLGLPGACGRELFRQLYLQST